MPEIVLVRYTRKPESLHEIESVIRYNEGKPEKTRVIEIKEMTTAEYDAFVARPLASRAWLAGKGGWDPNNVRLAIAVSAAGRRTLYVDPSGSDYARYIGMDISIPKYLDISVNISSANGDILKILDLCRNAAKDGGLSKNDILDFVNEATSDNYDHFIEICQRWFDCY